MSDTPYLAFYYRYYGAYVDEFNTLEGAATAMWQRSREGDLSFQYIMHDGEKVDHNKVWDRLRLSEEDEYKTEIAYRKPCITYTWHIKQGREPWYLGQYVCKPDESDLETARGMDERFKNLYGDALITKVTVNSV